MRSKIIFNIISTTRDQTNKNRENLLDGYRWLEMIADVFISNFCSRLTSQLVKINIALHSIIVSADKSEKLKWWIGTWIISWFLQNFNLFFLYRIVKLFNLTPRKRLLLYSYCKIWIYTVGVNTKFYWPSKFKIYISTIPEVLVILRDGILLKKKKLCSFIYRCPPYHSVHDRFPGATRQIASINFKYSDARIGFHSCKPFYPRKIPRKKNLLNSNEFWIQHLFSDDMRHFFDVC